MRAVHEPRLAHQADQVALVYRLTVFGAIIPAEVNLALRTWRFSGGAAP